MKKNIFRLKFSQIKGFTLVEMMAVIIILAIILLIAAPIVVNVVDNVRRESFKNSAHTIISSMDEHHVLNIGVDDYLICNNKLTPLDDLDFEIGFNGDFNGCGIVSYIERSIPTGIICNSSWCYVADENGDRYLIDNDFSNDSVVYIPKKLSNTASYYNVYVLNTGDDFVESKLHISRHSDEIDVSDVIWDEAITITDNVFMYKVDNNEPGTFFAHLLTETSDDITHQVSNSIRVMIDEQQRTEELIAFRDDRTSSSNLEMKYDFIQAYYYTGMSKPEILRDLKYLQRAGYEGLVFQISATTRGGTSLDDPMYIKDIWYESELNDYINEDTDIYHGVLDNVFSAAEELGMKVYIGTIENPEWWRSIDVVRENAYWRNQSSAFINELLLELHTRYGSSDAFAGFYYTYEMYSNNIGMRDAFTELLSNFVDGVHSIDSNIPILAGSYISWFIVEDPIDTYENFSYIIQNVNFKDGDIFLVQDGLGAAEYPVLRVYEYLNSFKSAIESSPVDLQFGLIMENFGNTKNATATNARFHEQIKSGLLLEPDILFTFSYTHYYNMFKRGRDDQFISRDYDIAYRRFIDLEVDVDSIVTGIESPALGSVYIDENFNETPLPAGFTVHSEYNVIKEGLVVQDQFNNEFVWVPTVLGVRPTGYEYLNHEWDRVAYARYLDNGVNAIDTVSDVLPVSSEYDQINKYYGFYVGRYESVFDYNDGNPRVAVRAASNADESFSWEFADSDFYTGYVWNNINYYDAKSKSESMSLNYGYNGVQTGLMNGKQLDSILKWIHSNDESFSIIYDARSWGNYIDSVNPATSGNYESGVLRPTGSNINWNQMNIFDIAGNLSAWTAELDDSLYVIRSNGYNRNGLFGAPTYGLASESFAFPHVGFRVVLYIE